MKNKAIHYFRFLWCEIPTFHVTARLGAKRQPRIRTLSLVVPPAPSVGAKKPNKRCAAQRLLTWTSWQHWHRREQGGGCPIFRSTAGLQEEEEEEEEEHLDPIDSFGM